MREPLPDLIARFHIKQSFFRKELVEAGVYDLDAYGCVMKTDKIFQPGDTIVLDLVMDMPLNEIRAEGITGLITEKTKHCSNFFYSIDFPGIGSDNSSPTSDKLRRIREVVLKKQSLKSRRSPGSVPGARQSA
ncbi:hypothetical protein LPB19_11745 [Marinobacter salinisoli]|uniref:PilZ domain-containing protein n=1 Tax=Marinobacter salinisoli TaxID=2769486 RepID=A0ABX7MNL7_9GAMM|nr:hypothetical protein [Marinobacter salinisoli]QSP93867.1 hypothetical protein LPB19_11745 [Marinobacter salinisoli]